LERIIKRQVLLGHEYSGNARLVRNLVESSLRTQAVRLVNKQYITRDDLMLIQSIDLLDAARRCQ
jgi:stage V sporulation protein K